MVNSNRIIFRNDDVNQNSNFDHIKEIYFFLRESFPLCEIWSGVSLFGKQNNIGSVYPDLPLRGRPLSYFYKADQFVNFDKLYSIKYEPFFRYVSHGMLHIDHAQISKEFQEFSIVTSCNLLKTNIFIAPYSSFNSDTERICAENNIKLCKPSDGWRSLESEPVNPSHKLWFFHSWRFTPESFKETIKRGIETNAFSSTSA